MCAVLIQPRAGDRRLDQHENSGAGVGVNLLELGLR